MKNLFFAAIASFAGLLATAQTAMEKFEISLPNSKVPHSFYKTVRLVDVRPDPKNLGIVQLGAFNRKARVVTETPLAEQLTAAMAALVDSAAGPGELFLLLQQLHFAEVTGGFSEKGYCHFRTVLFARRGEGFQLLDRMDTVIVVKGIDVTSNLLRQGSNMITGLLAANVAKVPDDGPVYTSSEVVNFESLEKKNIPLYTTAAYKSGLYKTFGAFAAQTPDEAVFAVEFTNKNRPAAVKRMNEKGKPQKVSSKELYALVYDGQPYVATDFGFYPLAKKGDDFYFTGKAKIAANSGNVVLASAFFGVMGGLIAASPGTAVFEMKLDYMSGGFIRLKEATEAAQSAAGH